MSDDERLLTPSRKKIDVPAYVKRGRAAATKRYSKTSKGEIAQQPYNNSRRKSVSRILKVYLNEILHNGVSIVKAEVLPLLHVDAPIYNDPLCSIDRQGVLSTSCGKDCHDSDEDDVDFVKRCIDGTVSE